MPFYNRAFPEAGTFPNRPGSLASVSAPADVVLAAHGLGYINGVGGDDWNGCSSLETGYPSGLGDGTTSPLGAPAQYCAARYKHNGGSTYVLADGHVKWFRGPSQSWRQASLTGVAWRKSLAPNAAAWFRED
jgi:prepilin-type processing-associated H-X9-DG protein